MKPHPQLCRRLGSWLLGLALEIAWASTGLADALPPDPYEALRLENDILGVRLWGPATQPTLSLGRSDIWDRRWFGERQPLITLARIRELAMKGQLSEVARNPNLTIYSLYNQYDFPCPKPGAQLILGTPFGLTAQAVKNEDHSVSLAVQGKADKLKARIWVTALRPLVVVEMEEGNFPATNLWVRLYRHWDTILPGQPVDPTLGGGKSGTNFERMPPPRALQAESLWAVQQDFPAELTFPDGFRVIAAATSLGATAACELQQDGQGLGTPLWAEKEGRLDHGVIKRYTPINQAPGAAATAKFAQLPKSFAIVVALVTSQDDPDPLGFASRMLREARVLGIDGLRREQAEALRKARRTEPAKATVDGVVRVAAPNIVWPSLRKADGYYSDVPLCTVGDTKFWFQDAGMWHNDFHLNEIRAEGLLTLGQFEEVLSYCRMIRTLLPQAQDNARDVYGLPGAMYPLVSFPLRCRGVPHTNLTWEQDAGLNGLVSKPLWLYYRYTGDKHFLREIAYPVLKECSRFLRAYLEPGADGLLHLIPTVSPEHWGLTTRFERNRDCTSALTLTRYLLQSASTAASILGVDGSDAADWRATADRLVSYPVSQTTNGPVWVDVADAPPIEYNVPVPLSPIFWGDHVGLDSPPELLALAKRTLEQIRVWEPHRGYLDSCVRPRLGQLRKDAPLGPENFLLSYQSIHLFPAVPSDADVTISNFVAQGGFLVTARCRKGEIEDVKIRSMAGETCRIAHPWPGRQVEVTETGTSKVITATRTDRTIVFPTQPGLTYVFGVRP